MNSVPAKTFSRGGNYVHIELFAIGWRVLCVSGEGRQDRGSTYRLKLRLHCLQNDWIQL